MFKVSELYELSFDKGLFFADECKLYFKNMNSLMFYVKQNDIVDYSVKGLELKEYVG